MVLIHIQHITLSRLHILKIFCHGWLILLRISGLYTWGILWRSCFCPLWISRVVQREAVYLDRFWTVVLESLCLQEFKIFLHKHVLKVDKGNPMKQIKQKVKYLVFYLLRKWFRIACLWVAKVCEPLGLALTWKKTFKSAAQGSVKFWSLQQISVWKCLVTRTRKISKVHTLLIMLERVIHF